MSSLVSVIMPAYNASEYLHESIDSVIAQTYLNWELIIIDDGSTDSTSAIAHKYEQSDKRIKYYYQQNSRQGKARNLGILKSNGSLLAFLDTDDIWLPDKLRVSIDLFEKCGHDLLFSEAYMFSDTSSLKEITSMRTLGIVAGTYKGEKGLSDLLYKNQIPLLSVLVKKEAALAVGCFRDRGVAEDYELWLNLLAAGYSLKGIDMPLAAYRIHKTSTTFKDGLAVNGVSIMLTDFFKEHPEIKTCYKSQIKVWLKRYILHHSKSGAPFLEFPAVFSEFKEYIRNYKFLLLLKPILPSRIFRYLLRKII